MRMPNSARSQELASFVARILMIGTTVTVFAVASATPAHASSCSPSGSTEAMQVTAECVDPSYREAVIDSEVDLAAPVPYHRVSGHFAGTDKKFIFAYPPKKLWKSRFFHQVYPLADEDPGDDAIRFGSASGGYVIQTNGGGGYRVDAAAAKFSKVVADRYYGDAGRIYGYIWGGSGGSYQTIAAMENTAGVWDGAVPYIIGDPTSIPNNFFIRAFARLLLQDKAPQIADAVSPGGSGDPFAGLDDTERSALSEVTRLGVPLRAWEDYRYVLGLDDPMGLLGFAAQIKTMDPTYADDFWSQPGYLGTEDSPLGARFRAARIDRVTKISHVVRDAKGVPRKLVLDSVPANASFTPLDVTVEGARPVSVQASLDVATKTITIESGNDLRTLDGFDVGDTLHVDNRWYVALTAYPRYQVPAADFDAYDQYRNGDGTPRYPQRPLAGSVISVGVSGGGTHSGAISGKVIAISNLLDTDAFPWHGDWYSAQVKRALGARYDDDFRMWFNDNADHIAPNRTDRLINYDGILQQALRDVSAWVETGQAPAPSTHYALADGQVEVPDKASDRHGIQPVVDLTAGGAHRLDVAAGEPVALDALIEVPPEAGTIVGIEWNPLGNKDFQAAPLSGPLQQRLEVSRTVTYPSSGTYFAELRVIAQRGGDARDPFARVENLGRVRVVVHEGRQG